MSQHRARKRFGQNFLHDPGVIQRIVHAISPKPGQRLVEIGPGQAALTNALLDEVGEMDAVELDRDLVELLPGLTHEHGKLRIHSADALKFDFRSLCPDGEKLRIVGNLPYNISTPLLFHLVSQVDVIADMHFMLQKEVVERISADPGEDDYGRLSIALQYYCEAEHLFNVGPGAFRPAPKVHSAIVRLTPHEKPPVTIDDHGLFNRMLSQAFSRRRKTLRNALKGFIDADAISAQDVDPGRRPETLSLEEFARLANAAEPE